MTALTTQRLRLRPLAEDDAAFYLQLVNEPAYRECIGDKGIRTLADARAAIAGGPMAMQARHGFSLYAVERRDDATLIGLCGLIKRDTLDHVDLGYALSTRHHGLGYAHEAADAVVAHARDVLALTRIVAVTSEHNDRSMRLLERLGFAFEQRIDWSERGVVRLYGRALEAVNATGSPS